MRRERQTLQSAAAELLALLEAAPAPKTRDRGSDPAAAHAIGQYVWGADALLPEQQRRTAATALFSPAAEKPGAEETVLRPAASGTGAERPGGERSRGLPGFLSGDSTSEVGVPGETVPGEGGDSGRMEDIDRFFRRDSRRYDRGFSEEGEI